MLGAKDAVMQSLRLSKDGHRLMRLCKMLNLQLLVVWGFGSSISSSCLRVSCLWQILGFHGEASRTLQHRLLGHMAKNPFFVVISVGKTAGFRCVNLPSHPAN